MKVVTRFAPSPTGALHLGGARTALFAYLWAMHAQGTFLLRIEDTDTQRSEQKHIDEIMQSMKWLGLEWSEPLWYQSKRMDVYASYVKKLLESGHAYYCTCSAEDIERMREEARVRGEQPKYNGACRNKSLLYTQGAVVRLKTPYDTEIMFHDSVKGTIRINTKELDDMILCRADGTPTYNLAVVVDDHEMGVTHVIRGDDHIANTPKQILLYNALEFPIPQFAHVPMILGADKQKLSKRHGATAVIDYKKQGFLPQAMVNYLVRLGWSYGDEELFSMQRLIELFTLEQLNPSPSAVDFDKLRWINAHYIKTLPAEYVARYMYDFFEQALSQRKITRSRSSFRYMKCSNDHDYLDFIITIVYAYKERVHTLVELAEQSMCLFVFYEDLDYSLATQQIYNGVDYLDTIEKELALLSCWTMDSITQLLHTYMQKHNLQNKDILPSLRFALTALKGGPDVPVLLLLLGKEESLLRINRFLLYSLKR